ncbi:unnamed protein product [Victoria cruziana]
MPSTGFSYFLRKAHLYLFSGEETLDLDASPAVPGTFAASGEHAQSGWTVSRPACMGIIRCKSTKKKPAHASGEGNRVERTPRGRNKVHTLSEAVAAPRRYARSQAAVGEIRMNLVAARLHRGTNEASLWSRRTQEEPPRLLMD